VEEDNEPQGCRREDTVLVVGRMFDMLLWEVRCVRNGVTLGLCG
jgi:hypothetical protein